MHLPTILFAPLLYLFIGLALGRLPLEIKGRASALLTQGVIPLVIIYNIATYRAGIFFIMLGMMLMMGGMVLLGRLLTRDPIQVLCLCYLNIGWLGLPVASTFFGHDAASVIIAAYIGSSLLGNSMGVALMTQSHNRTARLRQTLRAPPVWSLVLGLLGIPFGAEIEAQAQPLYEVLKHAMGFLGMAILGIWLSETKLKAEDFSQAMWSGVARLIVVSVMVTGFIQMGQYAGIALVTENQPTLYLLGFLPPAANIIVLETHYLKSGRSAGMIASGTCLSILAISLYVSFLLWA